MLLEVDLQASEAAETQLNDLIAPWMDTQRKPDVYEGTLLFDEERLSRQETTVRQELAELQHSFSNIQAQLSRVFVVFYRELFRSFAHIQCL